MKKVVLILFIQTLCLVSYSQARSFTISGPELFDKIKGGLTGQLIGNLNGLPFEQKYNNEPGTLSNFIPSLPAGAFTDDDTDIEWVSIFWMDSLKQVKLSPETIVKMWTSHINYGIYASNAYARELMSVGFYPPETGNIFINPWSRVNVAGQFNCETFAFTAPGMCSVAEDIAMHYTSVPVSQEPLQSTQLFSAMISRAFVTSDLRDILISGISALDPHSMTYQAVEDAITWHKRYPDDWRQSRKEIRRKYYFTDNSNKALRNTASIISQFLYGRGDFVRTMEISFNWGFDADCNAATIASILGVIKGYHWFEQQGWEIGDKYCNTTRPGMPRDETISRFAQRIFRVSEQVIRENGGKGTMQNGVKVFTIMTGEPEILATVKDETEIFDALYSAQRDFVMKTFGEGGSEKDLARAAYLSYSLKMAEDVRDLWPSRWDDAVGILETRFPGLVRVLMTSPGNYMAEIARRTGLVLPEPSPDLDGKYEFRLSGYTDACKVQLGGTMNHWKSWMNPMQRTDDGWVCRINLKPGKYEYKFIVDGKPIFDPGNDNRETNCEYRTNSIFIAE